MKKSSVLSLCFIWCIITSVKGHGTNIPKYKAKLNIVFQEVKVPAHSCVVFSDTLKANVKDTIVYHKKHRLIAALLAFPVLGIFGLHRIYMHTAPIVPLVYIATAGGLFGVLPFIDFVLILLNKDIHLTYTSNPHLFMWQKR